MKKFNFNKKFKRFKRIRLKIGTNSLKVFAYFMMVKTINCRTLKIKKQENI